MYGVRASIVATNLSRSAAYDYSKLSEQLDGGCEDGRSSYSLTRTKSGNIADPFASAPSRTRDQEGSQRGQPRHQSPAPAFRPIVSADCRESWVRQAGRRGR
eukprot:1653736-Pleurochrysis_carterae.AAC.1